MEHALTPVPHGARIVIQVPAKTEFRPVLSAPGIGAFLLRWKWLLAPVLLGSVAAAFVYHDLDSPRASNRQATGVQSGLPLKLSVSEDRNQLDVMWDRNVPAIVHAKRGLLSISDGSNQQELELNGVQLRTGRVHYSPLSDDVRLRLEVVPEGQRSVGESIRVFREVTP
jgi:hypothetical protein